MSSLSAETGFDRATVRKILCNTKGVSTDGRAEYFTMRQFIDAHLVYNTRDKDTLDLKKEQARYYQAKADLAQVELASTDCQMMSVTEFLAATTGIAASIKRVILKSNLPRDDQNEILKELRELGTAVRDTAEQRGKSRKPERKGRK